MGVIVSLLTSGVVDHRELGQIEDYYIDISTKQAALRSKSKYSLAGNHNNVSRVERHVYNANDCFSELAP